MSKGKTFLLIALGALALMVPALLNGFPFIFPDSGDYLVLHPLLHRSPYYGLLVRVVDMNRFIWMPIVMQCALMSHLLWTLMRLTTKEMSAKLFLPIVIFLTVFSSLPYFTGFIMADIFTPILLLGMYILAFHYAALARLEVAYFLLLCTVAIMAHISNLTLGVGFMAFLVLWNWLANGAPKKWSPALPLLTIPLVTGIAAILLFNIAIFSSWSLAPAGQSFLLANLIQYGPARHYLQEACPTANYKICAFVNELPETADKLLWSSDIFHKLGDFPGMQVEAREIVHKTVQTYPLETVQMVVTNFANGLVTHEPAAEFYPENQVGSFPELISLKFGAGALAAYQNSAEMQNRIPHDLLRMLDNVVCPVSFIALILIGVSAWENRRSDTFSLSLCVVYFILMNTVLCTTLSGVHDRYQARVTWLAPLAVAILLSQIMLRKRSN